MKRKILLTFILAATLIAIFAISVSAEVRTYDCSVTLQDNVIAESHYVSYSHYWFALTGYGNSIPIDIEKVPLWWFINSSKYSYVKISAGITGIGKNTFSGFSNLSKVYISDMKSWCHLNFGNTNANPLAYAENLYLNDVLVEDLIVPNDTTKISNYAFVGCKSIKSIVIPDSVTYIGELAFKRCDNLKAVQIGSGVTNISNSAFDYCYGLESIVVDENNTEYMSIDGNLYTKDGKTLVKYATGKTDEEFVIPYGVTTVDANAFIGCQNLKKVIIPNSVSLIGDCAFQDCTNLANIAISKSVTIIGNCAFYNCSSLTNIIIPKNVTNIGNYAFWKSLVLTIYVEAESKPRDWQSSWNDSNRPVVWGHTHAYEDGVCVCGMVNGEGYLNEIFAFKGYSFNETGSIAIGFDIDYEAIALYEELTGETLEIGVVFAGYELLNGQNPLDGQGNVIAIANGFAAKCDLSNYSYTTYDFVLTDITEDIRDIPLVIAAYINNGSETKYVQSNGISDTVSGITYNEVKENN